MKINMAKAHARKIHLGVSPVTSVLNQNTRNAASILTAKDFKDNRFFVTKCWLKANKMTVSRVARTVQTIAAPVIPKCVVIVQTATTDIGRSINNILPAISG